MKHGGRLCLLTLTLSVTAAAQAGEVVLDLVHLRRDSAWVAFAIPIPREGATTARVFAHHSQRPIADASVHPILCDVTPAASCSARAWQVQIPRSALGTGSRVRLSWMVGDPGAPRAMASYASLRFESPETVNVVGYSIARRGSQFLLATSPPTPRTILAGWEPGTIALPPPGYLASTGIFGDLLSLSSAQASPRLSGMRFLSENLRLFGLGALYDEGYNANNYAGKPGEPGSAAVVDLGLATEAWLYDRCATYLLAYVHTGELRFYRHGLRACSFYASKVDARGLFTLKTDPKGSGGDPKYSHVRGLYFYYALTGDESALEAGRRIARMWLNDPFFVRPYRQGRVRGPDKLWTERLLAHALESLVYGYLLTREPDLLTGAKELFETAWQHISAPDGRRLKAIIGHALAPQPCLVHTAGQHEGWSPAEPFCSPWMSALLVDPLLRYESITGDSRVDGVLARLGRYLRDTANTYFYGNPLGDSFLSPSRCYTPAPAGQPVRMLVPLYGAARRTDGSRYMSSEWDDFDHCADATALSAAALRAVRRLGVADYPGPPPFRTEGDSFLALHHELAHCAAVAFRYFSRTNRDPRSWTSAQLAKGYGDQEFVIKNKIGWSSHFPAPLRKLSWWFNGSLLQFRLLEQAGVSIDVLRPGAIQPAECR